jgi:hypothetical protein
MRSVVRTSDLRAAHAVRLTRGALIALLALTALALSACQMAEQSVNVNQSRIWTGYELHYDANTDLTTAKATFRFGNSLGTPLDLTSPSEVRFNGEMLSRTVQPGTGFVSYERTFAGEVTTGTFRFTDVEGEAYSNTVTLRNVDLPAGIGPIDNDAAYAFEWVGASLAPSEEVSVTLFRLAPGTASLGVFRQTQDGARTVVMDALQLRNVAPGDVTLRMTREWSGSPGRAPDAGGKVSLKWSARDAVATIVD